MILVTIVKRIINTEQVEEIIPFANQNEENAGSICQSLKKILDNVKQL